MNWYSQPIRLLTNVEDSDMRRYLQDVMSPVSIYKDFNLLEKSPAVESFRWTRRFSRPGQFMLTTDFSPEKLELYKPTTVDRAGNIISEGNIIIKRDTSDAAIITQLRIISNFEGQLRMFVEGQFIPQVLDRRVFSLQGNFTPTQLLTNITNSNFQAGAGAARNMSPLVRVMPIPGFASDSTAVEYRRHVALDAITDICQGNNIGLRGRYNIPNRSFDIEFYLPEESRAKFDIEYGNVIEQDYIVDSENFKNVVYVGDNFVHNNHITGFSRREVVTSEPSAGSTSLQQTARDALNRNRFVRTLTSQVDAMQLQFPYMQDWDVGSIVLSRNRDIGFSEREIITEVVEFVDEKGLHIEVNTGDYLERRGA